MDAIPPHPRPLSPVSRGARGGMPWHEHGHEHEHEHEYEYEYEYEWGGCEG